MGEKGLAWQESGLEAEPQRSDGMTSAAEFPTCFGTFLIADILAQNIRC